MLPGYSSILSVGSGCVTANTRHWETYLSASVQSFHQDLILWAWVIDHVFNLVLLVDWYLMTCNPHTKSRGWSLERPASLLRSLGTASPALNRNPQIELKWIASQKSKAEARLLFGQGQILYCTISNWASLVGSLYSSSPSLGWVSCLKLVSHYRKKNTL